MEEIPGFTIANQGHQQDQQTENHGQDSACPAERNRNHRAHRNSNGLCGDTFGRGHGTHGNELDFQKQSSGLPSRKIHRPASSGQENPTRFLPSRERPPGKRGTGGDAAFRRLFSEPRGGRFLACVCVLWTPGGNPIVATRLPGGGLLAATGKEVSHFRTQS